MVATKDITRETEGLNQLGEHIGKPKVGDVVKVKYSAYTVKNGKKYAQIIDTSHVGPLVSFKVCDTTNKDHKGLYAGLNEVIQTMNLGEEATVQLTSDLAFGEIGLDRYYDASGGYVKSQMGVLGTCMPNDPKSPPSHHDRNPLCVAYVGVAPNTDIILENLALMEINNHRREIPKQSCCDIIMNSIAQAFGLNSGTF